MPLQRAGRRADFERGLNRRIKTAPDRNIEREIARLHRYPRKTCRAQDVRHALLGGKCKRTRVFRTNLRQLRNVFVDRLKRRHHPGVFARLPPAGEHQPTGWPQRAAQIGKGKHRVCEKHHAETRDQQIETCRVERICRGVRQHEIDRQPGRRDLPRAAQHRRRDVDAQDMAGRTNLLCQRNRRGAAAATDIHDPFADPGPGAVDQDVGDRRQHGVLRLLAIGPALAGRAVPECDLIRVLIVILRYVHGDSNSQRRRLWPALPEQPSQLPSSPAWARHRYAHCPTGRPAPVQEYCRAISCRLFRLPVRLRCLAATCLCRPRIWGLGLGFGRKQARPLTRSKLRREKLSCVCPRQVVFIPPAHRNANGT